MIFLVTSFLSQATIPTHWSSLGDGTEGGEREKGGEEGEGNKDSYLSDVENEAKEGQARKKKRELSFLVNSMKQSTIHSKAQL